MAKLLSLLMSLVLAACSPASMTDLKEDPAPVPAITAPVETVRFEVETETREDAAVAEDGTVLVEYTLSLPVLTAYRGDGTVLDRAQNETERRALKTVDAFNTRFEKWIEAEEFQETIAFAKEDYAWRKTSRDRASWRPYVLDLSCGVYRTESLVSVSGAYYSDTGGAHPNTYLLSWNFDLKTGAFFDPKLLSDGTELQDWVTKSLVRQARIRATEDDLAADVMFWTDYETILADWSSYAVYFDQEGMTVAFSPYELACYAAGPQIFQLSYEDLAPHLSDHGQALLGLEAEE